MLRFAHIEYLWGLAAIPLFLLIFLWVNNWKQKALKALGHRQVINKIVPAVSFSAPKIKFALFMLAFAFLVVGIADPQIGSKIVEEKRKGLI
ncbi:BatA domain-containing protein [Mucilaginibacter antarcticus]|uniref:BatA domain-containing protein n=1 Tax=Mucilaginibacter antarcticus TaxID=1855725 RepID=UPI003634AFB8